MLRFVIGRLVSAAFVVLGVVLIVFLLIHLVPGDPVEVMLGETAAPADRAALRERLELDLPLYQQCADYLLRLAQLDLGVSLYSQQPIADILAERIPATLLLAFAGLSVAVLIAVPLGILAALSKDTAWDYAAMGCAMLGISIPNFWLGPLLIILFSIQLGWLPVSGNSSPLALVLPALTLGTALAAVLSRMVRSSLLEVLGEDYIRTAWCKGLDPRTIVLRHAMSNAGLPVVTVLGLQLGALLGGAVITEMIFEWPGVGQLTIEAIQRRDYPVLQACVLVISLSYVIVNTLTDLVYAWLDPRIRLQA
jgi:peptide/nickel transport system permease protein